MDTVDCGDYVDYGYFGPCGLLIQWIIAYRDYVYSGLLGLCGLWVLWIMWIVWIMDTVDDGYSGLWGLCIQWIAGIMGTLDHVDYG